jgi:hypothetical protein
MFLWSRTNGKFSSIIFKYGIFLFQIFKYFLDLDEFTEELLEEHEKELEEINMYYIHNEQLFVNLANWHEVWAEYREFQVNLNEILKSF